MNNPKVLDASPEGISAGLTARQIDCLRHLAMDGTHRDKAQAMGITKHTYKNHLTAAYSRLGVANAAQALVLALCRGILCVDELVAPAHVKGWEGGRDGTP